jgi:hypothetical protein
MSDPRTSEERDPEGFTSAAREQASKLIGLGADVQTLSPGKAAAWLHGHCFLIKDDGELLEL